MADKARQTLRPEDEISHYRIVSPLGAGGMGEVYLAEDRTLGRNVALKILPLDLVRNEDRVRRFEFEARSASQLSHPNIVTIYEIGRHPVRSAGAPDSEPLHYIAMEVVSGKTLGSLIHEEKTDLRTLLGYLAQAAEGLAKAHAAGIVHRDLKPGNLMVSADGFTKVLDFGLAKLTERSGGGRHRRIADSHRGGSEVGSIVGTAGYMSPEQVAGRPVDTRSDIFSFGCVLYEAATRREPFAASTGVETMHKILNEKPVPVEELNDKAPAELRRLIRRCLAKSPDQRVQSIKDLALELREIVEEYDALSASASSASSIAGATPAAPPRRRIATPAFAAVALLGVAGLAFGLWALLGKRSAPARRRFRDDAHVDPDEPRRRRRCDALARRPLPRLRRRPVGAHRPAGAAGRDRQRRRGAAGERGRGRVSRLLPGRQLPLLPLPQARQPAVPRALLGAVARRDAARDPLRRRLAGHLLARRQAGRLLARRAPEAAEPAGRLRSRRLARARAGDSRRQRNVFRARPPGRPTAGRWRRCSTSRSPCSGFRSSSSRPRPAARRTFLELPRVLFSSLAWLPDGSGLVAAGVNLKVSLQEQVYLITYPDGRLQPVTNDFQRYFGVSVSGGETATAAGSAMAASPAIAAVRQTRLANLWLADAAGGAAASAHLDHQPGEVADELLGGRRRTGDLRRAAGSDPPDLDRRARRVESRERSPPDPTTPPTPWAPAT